MARSRFPKPKKEKIARTYCPCPDADGIVDDLIEHVHTELQGCDIRVLLQAADIRERGAMLPAKPVKIAGLHAWHARGINTEAEGRPIFCILYNSRAYIHHDEATRKAVLDTCLCACGKDDKGKLFLRAPDFAGFRAAIARNGLYSDSLKLMARTAKDAQPLLELVESDAEVERKAAEMMDRNGARSAGKARQRPAPPSGPTAHGVA